MKTINESFTPDEFKKLVEKKGERSWREAILEEFEVNETEN